MDIENLADYSKFEQIMTVYNSPPPLTREEINILLSEIPNNDIQQVIDVRYINEILNNIDIPF